MSDSELSFLESQLATQPKKQQLKVVGRKSNKAAAQQKVSSSEGCTSCLQLNAFNYSQCHQTGVTYVPVKCATCYQISQNQPKVLSLVDAEESFASTSDYQFTSYGYGHDPQLFYQSAYQAGCVAGYSQGYRAGYEAAQQDANHVTETKTKPSSSDGNGNAEFDAMVYAESIKQKNIQAKIDSMEALLDSIDEQNQANATTNIESLDGEGERRKRRHEVLQTKTAVETQNFPKKPRA